MKKLLLIIASLTSTYQAASAAQTMNNFAGSVGKITINGEYGTASLLDVQSIDKSLSPLSGQVIITAAHCVLNNSWPKLNSDKSNIVQNTGIEFSGFKTYLVNINNVGKTVVPLDDGKFDTINSLYFQTDPNYFSLEKQNIKQAFFLKSHCDLTADISILILDKKINAAGLKLPSKNVCLGESVSALGYGSKQGVRYGQKIASLPLQITSNFCDGILGATAIKDFGEKELICKRIVPCDSGSPIISEESNSWAGTTATTGVMMNIFYYSEWIKRVLMSLI